MKKTEDKGKCRCGHKGGKMSESFHYMLIELIAAVRVDERDSNRVSKQEVKDLLQSVMAAYANRIPEGEVSVMNPQGTEETGIDRPASPFSLQCQHNPMAPHCTLRHQFTQGRTRCDICGGIFTLPLSTADLAQGATK